MAVIEVCTPEHEPIEVTTEEGEERSMCVCGVMVPEDLDRDFVRWFLAHLASGRFLAYDIMDSEKGRRRQLL